MKTTIAKIIGFVTILYMVLGYVNHVLTVKFDDGIYNMKKFYDLEENTVDVLILGSSHAYADINTGTLWREHGIASYVLSGSTQPMWNTYFYLKEALKTQTPELIVLEGYKVLEIQEFTESVVAVKSIMGLKWSGNRIQAIKASVPDENRLEFLLGYTQYHDRYANLSSEDFAVNKGLERYEDWKGTLPILKTTPMEIPDISRYTEYGELMEKTETYYRAIIELAQEKEIPILVVVSPYAGITRRDQVRFNTAEEIAEEYGVPFINYNLMAETLLIDYKVDMAEASHLNCQGSHKFTIELGKYISEHYEISDHRGDPAYSSWERDAEYLYALMENQKLQEIDDILQLSEYIINPNYNLVISIDGYCLTEEAAINCMLTKLGIQNAKNGGIWYFTGKDGLVWNSGDGEDSQYFEFGRHDLGFKRMFTENDRYENMIFIDNQRYQKVTNGMNVIVYDTITDSIADTFGIDADDSYRLWR